MDSLKERDFRNYEEVRYIYETPETGLFESTKIIDGLEFANIESLKKELNNQYGIIAFEEDDYEEKEVEKEKGKIRGFER